MNANLAVAIYLEGLWRSTKASHHLSRRVWYRRYRTIPPSRRSEPEKVLRAMQQERWLIEDEDGR